MSTASRSQSLVLTAPPPPPVVYETNTNLAFQDRRWHRKPNLPTPPPGQTDEKQLTSAKNISLGYHGTYILDDAMKQILAGAPFEGKLPFGPGSTYLFSIRSGSRLLTAVVAAAYLTFEVGNEKYKALEDTTFVGDARFIVEGGNLAVESRWSAVVSSTDSD